MTDAVSLETYRARRDYAMKIERAKAKRLSNAERQRAYKAKMEKAGLVQVNGWVHRHQAADIQDVMHRLKSDPDLMAGPLRSICTGKLARLR